MRVVVSRRRAEVPHCPNWSLPAQPNYDNRNMSNFGCGVNTNIAAMVANPEDLVHGREGVGTGDVRAAAKAVQYFRPPACLFYTSDASDDLLCVDLGGRRIM